MSSFNTDFERNPDSVFSTSELSHVLLPGQDVLDIIKPIPGAFIAGGFMIYLYNPIAHKTKDIDVFFTNKNAIDLLREELEFRGWTSQPNSPLGCEDWRHPDFIWTMQLVIGKIYDNPFHIIDGFSLRCCQIASDGANVYWHPQALTDARIRVINIHRITNIENVKKHILNYMAKGFRLTTEAFELLFKTIKPQTPPQKQRNIPFINATESYSIKELSKRSIKI